MPITNAKKDFIQEVILFLIFLGVFIFMPLNQFLIQASIVCLFLLTLAISKKKKYSLKDLGLMKPSKSAILAWVYCTFALLLLIILLKIVFPAGVFYGAIKSRNDFTYYIPFYLLISSFLQEFVFRGYVFARTKALFSTGTTILLNIFLFSLLHLPYMIHFHSNLMYLSIIAGVFWAITYVKHPNLYLAWLSHALVGSLSLILLQKF